MAVFNGDSAANTYTGTGIEDFINGQGGDDTLDGQGGNDIIIGGAGKDIVSGGGGDDIVQIGAFEIVAGESYSGGSGTDTLRITSLAPAAGVVSADFRSVTLSSFEKLSFAGGNTHYANFNSSQVGPGLSSLLAVDGGTGSNNIGITMNSATVNLGGWSFANWGANDSITIRGTAANETATGTGQADWFKLGSGVDQVFAGGGDDRIDLAKVGIGSVFDGGAGTDTIYANQDVVDLTRSTLTSLENLVFRGSGQGASHTVMVEADQFAANGLDFGLKIDGVAGDVNTLTVFMAQQQSINLQGVSAIDPLADTRASIIGDDDAESIGGTAMNDLISGNGGNDVLYGYDGNDTLVGGAGDDVMHGGKGSDIYFVDSAGDQVGEKSLSADDGGIDLVHATGINYTLGELVENLTLHGGNLNGTGNGLANVITGTDGDNTLKGANGGDTLIGGKGVDVLIGGSGADKFVFTSILDSGTVDGLRDRVADFVSGGDWIDVSAIDANTSIAGDQAFTLDTDGGELGQGQFRITYNGDGTAIAAFNNNIGSAPDMEIFIQNVTAPLKLTDFIL